LLWLRQHSLLNLDLFISWDDFRLKLFVKLLPDVVADDPVNYEEKDKDWSKFDQSVDARGLIIVVSQLVVKEEVDITTENNTKLVCLVHIWRVQYICLIREVENLWLIPVIISINEIFWELMHSVDHGVWETFFELHHVSYLRVVVWKFVMLNFVWDVVVFVSKLVLHCHDHCIVIVHGDELIIVLEYAWNFLIVREFCSTCVLKPKICKKQLIPVFPFESKHILLLIKSGGHVLACCIEHRLLFIFNEALHRFNIIILWIRTSRSPNNFNNSKLLLKLVKVKFWFNSWYLSSKKLRKSTRNKSLNRNISRSIERIYFDFRKHSLSWDQRSKQSYGDDQQHNSHQNSTISTIVYVERSFTINVKASLVLKYRS